MLKHSLITKNYLDNRSQPLSSSQPKTKSEIQKLFFKEKSQLPPLVQQKDFFMQQLIKHQKSTNSLIDNKHSKSAQSLSNVKKQNQINQKALAPAFSSAKKGKIIFNLGQARKISRDYLILYSSNQQSKQKSYKIERKSIKNMKFLDRKQVANRKQLQKSTYYLQDSHKYLSALSACQKNKKKFKLKSKQKPNKTEISEMKDLQVNIPIIKSENITSRSKCPEIIKLKKVLHAFVANDNFEKYKSTTQHYDIAVNKRWVKNQKKRTLNRTFQHLQCQRIKNDQKKYLQPWINLYPSQNQLFNSFVP